MKTIAIMQPYFFPYIGYFQLINSVDKYLLYNKLNYIKEGWIHRNRILKVNGEPFYITANVAKKSSFKKICDIKLDYKKNWQKQLLHSIYYNYKKSPFFEEIYFLVEQIINYDTEYLYKMNEVCIINICHFLGIDTEILCYNELYSDLEKKLLKVDSQDYSDFPFLEGRTPIKKVLRVIEICRRETANVFINAIGGQLLYDKSDFASYGIELKFVNTKTFSYPQNSSTFVPNLSIIDVLMNCGRDKTRLLLGMYYLT